VNPKPITYAREVYSPSQLEMAKRCLRSWVLRYVYGVKTQSAAGRSKVLGTLIHKAVEIYIGGRSMLSLTLDDLDDYTRKEIDAYVAHRADVLFAKALKKDPYLDTVKGQVDASMAAKREVDELLREAPQRALAGLAHLPPLEQCAQRFAEVQLQVSVSGFRCDPVQFSDMSKLDLVVQANDGQWFLYDHKSTKGKPGDPWAYVPSAEQLKTNVQLLIYALCVMQQTGAASLWCRWIYYYTGQGAPDSKAVDVFITREEVISNLEPWLDLADSLGVIIRETKATNKLPPLEQFGFPDAVHDETESPCDAYGGCGYRNQQCHPPMLSVEQILERTRSAKQVTSASESKGAEDIMGLDQRVQQQFASGAPVLPGTQPMSAPVAPQVNPPGFQYVPNVNNQFVVAPPGHPAHTGVPAGYQYPPGPVPVAGGVVEVPVASGAAAVYIANEQAAQRGQATQVADPGPEPTVEEKPKRKRRTKEEIDADKLSPAARASLEAGIESAKTEPLVDLGSFAQFADDTSETIDSAVVVLARRAREIGCDIDVSVKLKGGAA
jgi:hypothetical protein